MRLDAEANLQAEFYHACRLINLPVALEITTPAGRLDAGILNLERNSLLAVVEVKRSKLSFNEGRSRQIINYKALGLPVYGLHAGTDPHALAATIQRATTGQPGKLLAIIEGMTHLKEKRLAERRARKLDRLREDYTLRS